MGSHKKKIMGKYAWTLQLVSLADYQIGSHCRGVTGSLTSILNQQGGYK